MRAAGVVRCMLAQGVPRGAFVGLCAHNSAAHVEVLLACMLGGFVAVPLSLHLTEDHAAHIVQVCIMCFPYLKVLLCVVIAILVRLDVDRSTLFIYMRRGK